MLKFIVSISLVFCFLLQNFSKLIIVINYQINKEYISKNLCVNRDKPDNCCEGKCELKKELDADDKKQDIPANSNKDKYEKENYVRPNKNGLWNQNKKADLNFSFSFYPTKTIPHSVFHPPQA